MRAAISLSILWLLLLLTPLPVEGEQGDWQEREVDPSEWEDGPVLEGSPMDEAIVGDPVVLFTVRYTPSLSASEVTGEIVIELFPEWVPITAWNFINLTEDSFYDGIFFHRVIDDFVAQSGDPSCYTVGVYPVTTASCGEGGSGETIPLEHHENMSHVDGAIGMARSLDPDSAESQFYICDGEQHGLDPENRDDDGYVTFGVVRDGMSHVRAIAAVPTSNAPLGGEVFQVPPGPDRPIDEVHIVSIEMLGVVGGNNSLIEDSQQTDSQGGFLPAPSFVWLAAIPAARRLGFTHNTSKDANVSAKAQGGETINQCDYCDKPTRG